MGINEHSSPEPTATVMTSLAITLVGILAAVTVASGQLAYVFPAEAETRLSAPLQNSFSCENLNYGYYADTDNNCEVFHVCLPVTDDAGALLQTTQFSFICGNGTVFSQESLTCVHTDDALPCVDARNLYDSSNAQFGVIPEGNNNIDI